MTTFPTIDHSAPELWTIGKLLSWSAAFLAERNVSTSPRLDAELLLAEALGETRVKLYMAFDKPIKDGERAKYREYISRRAKGEPVAYILGHREFMGHLFKVTPAVLIPRADTETLVEAAIAYCLNPANGITRVLDIGTGSGCIAVSLAKACPGLTVEAWDVAPEALAVAQENVRLHGVQDRVICRHIDARVALGGSAPSLDSQATFDLIVSNPPYISSSERKDMGVGVAEFEPSLALMAEQEGLEFYSLFARHAGPWLRDRGMLMCEVGWQQGRAVEELFANATWGAFALLQDIERRDRVVTVVKR